MPAAVRTRIPFPKKRNSTTKVRTLPRTKQNQLKLFFLIAVSSWSPSSSDKMPYFTIDLLKDQPVFGVQIKGNPKRDEYVTSYEVMHSADGLVFSPIIDSSLLPEKFRGSVDANTPALQKFSLPFEARYVKIIPKTWHEKISLRVDVIGCGIESTTTMITSEAPEVCINPRNVI